MRITTKLIFATAISIAVACTQNQKQPEEKTGHSKMEHHQTNDVLMKSMDGNMADMHKVQLTGNPDYDFAAMMVPHHEAAISMSMALLKTTQKQEFINFGLGVIDAQKKEVEQLKSFLKTADKTPIANADAFRKAMNGTMGVMMKSMDTVKKIGNIDKDYAHLMIPHHQSAINMAKVYLPYAKNTNIKKLAEEVIRAQEKEVVWLKTQ